MHSKFILAVSIVVLQFSWSQARVHSVYEGGRSLGVVETQQVAKPVNDDALKKYIAQNIKQIEETLPRLSTAHQKLDFISKRVKLISEYREKNWSKSAFVEQQLDLEIKPFESFPLSNEFRTNRCGQYLNTLLVDWEPSAPAGRPSQAGVARAHKILSDICR